MKHFYFIILLLILPFRLLADKPGDIRQIETSSGDSTVIFYVRISSKDITPNTHLLYYWEHKNVICQNQGGFSGNLLHGSYKILSKQGKLLRTGEFHNGTKNNEWKEWDAQGQLLKTENWQKGIRTQIDLYNNGSIAESIIFTSNGAPNKRYVYSTNNKQKFTYKKGEWKQKQPWFKWGKNKSQTSSVEN